MKTKEIAFTLPIIIVIYEFMFFEGNIKKRMLYLIPMLLTMLIIPLSLIGIDKPIGDAIGELREASQETEQISRWSYLFTQFRVIVTYIRLLFLPINQNLDYDYPLYHAFFNPEVFLSFLFLLLIFACGIYLLYAKRYTLSASRFLSFGIFWFFITLSVESSIIPIRDVIFEHRLYLPSVGLFFAIITSIFLLADKLKSRWQKVNRAVVVTLAIVIAVLSITTYARNIIWQDEVSLWEDVVRKSLQKARGHNNLGIAYKDKGLTDKAIEHYQIALRLKPDYEEIHNNMGVAYRSKHMLDNAIEHYQAALNINQDYSEAYNNLGNVYLDKGLIDQAVTCFNSALRLKPDYAEAHYNLGLTYKAKGAIDTAKKHFEIAMKLNPDFAQAYYGLGNISMSKGQYDQAVKYYLLAVKLKPDFTDAYYDLGNAYLDKGQYDQAVQYFLTAVKLKPDFADAYYNLAISYKAKRLNNEAMEYFKIALSLKPEFKETLLNLQFNSK